jgi:hypothetical protein
LTINGKALAEYASDVQTGLGLYQVSDFRDLRLIGMAALLAINLRGLDDIPYEVLSMVSDHRFDIPNTTLPAVLRLLSEVGMVKLYEKGRAITKVSPEVPYFDDIFDKVGQVSGEFTYNEVEQATVAILAELRSKPENRDRLLHRTGMEAKLLDRVLKIGETGGLVRTLRTRAQNILISPLYFADNNDALADLAAKAGSDDLKVVFDAIKSNQGWPLSMIVAQQAVAGKPLTPVQVELAHMLAQENMLKPPTIKVGESDQPFLFTPMPGGARLSPSQRHIYERAMALLAAVRKGQLLPVEYSINRPMALLGALKNKGFIGANSEAIGQYGKLAIEYQLGRFVEARPGMYEFHLNGTEENNQAVDIAIDLLTSSEPVNLRVDRNSQNLLRGDEAYVRSVIAARDIREHPRVTSAEANESWAQLTLGIS